ncbi:MAG: hypothetical protein MJZ92_04450 [Paludibacteraceae bacterium]|nr:hypothetical protein [Paludibacteraceae bacterium]
MKKFIKESIVLTVIVFIFALLYDVYLSYSLLYDQHRVYVGWSDIYTDTTKYDLVINGNSRAWVQYSPMILDTILNINSYNLGIDGSGIDRQMVKYRKYCEHHGQPKFLIQNLEYFTMKTTNGYEQWQFYPYFVVDRKMIRELRETEHFRWADLYIPFYRYLGINQIGVPFYRYLGISQFEDTVAGLYKGYQAQNIKWDGTKIASMDTVGVEKDSIMIGKFSNFIKEQKALGTKILFVYAPIYHVASEKCYDKEIILNIYDSIATIYNVQILNYLEDEICYDSTYFYNATHMNFKGAELFSTKLAHDLDSLGFCRKYPKKGDCETVE